jgi:hypothetical protein
MLGAIWRLNTPFRVHSTLAIRVRQSNTRAVAASALRSAAIPARRSSSVERVLTLHQMLPQWLLRDANPTHRKKRAPRVSLPIAEGWPAVSMSADHAEDLGRQLIEAPGSRRFCLRRNRLRVEWSSGSNISGNTASCFTRKRSL